jgi:hypothetical protein
MLCSNQNLKEHQTIIGSSFLAQTITENTRIAPWRAMTAEKCLIKPTLVFSPDHSHVMDLLPSNVNRVIADYASTYLPNCILNLRQLPNSHRSYIPSLLTWVTLRTWRNFLNWTINCTMNRHQSKLLLDRVVKPFAIERDDLLRFHTEELVGIVKMHA